MANGDLESGTAGALSGGAKGMALGSNPALMAATSGLSAPIGAGIGALAGGISSVSKNRKANIAQNIPFVDPMESKRLAELELERKNISAGTDALTQNSLQENVKVNRATQNAISKNTGGNSSMTIDALIRAQRNSQNGVNAINANSQQRIPYFDNAQSALLSRVADRKLQLQLLNRAQKTAESAQSRTDNNVSANAATSTGVLDGAIPKAPINGGPDGGIGSGVKMPSASNQSIPDINQGVASGLNPEGNENSILNLTEYFNTIR